MFNAWPTFRVVSWRLPSIKVTIDFRFRFWFRFWLISESVVIGRPGQDASVRSKFSSLNFRYHFLQIKLFMIYHFCILYILSSPHMIIDCVKLPMSRINCYATNCQKCNMLHCFWETSKICRYRIILNSLHSLNSLNSFTGDKFFRRFQ